MPVRTEVATRYEELDGKPAELTMEVIDAFASEMSTTYGTGSLEYAHALALYARRARWTGSDLEQGRRTMEQALALVGEDLRPTNQVWWRHLLTLLCNDLGDGEATIRAAQETSECARRVGQAEEYLRNYRAIATAARAWREPAGTVLDALRVGWAEMTDAQRGTVVAILQKLATLCPTLSDADRAALRAVTKDTNGVATAMATLTPTADLEALRAALAELDALTGLPGVKRQVRRLVAELRIRDARRDAGLPVPESSYHLAFLGPPGTGKTTVARLLGRVFKALGILPTDRLVETDRSGLVAQYIGQTAPMVNAKVDEALGGVLFIDEAYTLAGAGTNDFGQEAVATLLKRMEDDRHRLVVVLAGYRDEMQQLLASNPGLRSRVSTVVDFRSYRTDELVAIMHAMFDRQGFELSPDASTRAGELCGLLRAAADDRSFGNAREIRNIVEDTVGAQAVRLERDLDAGHPLDRNRLRRIEADDVTWSELGDPSLEPLPAEQARLVAVHEAGHALVRQVGGASPPVLITVVPSSDTLGRTFYAADESPVVVRTDLIAMAAAALGGRAAEEEVYGYPSAGALGDLVKAERVLFDALRAGLSEDSSDQALAEYVLSGAGTTDPVAMSGQARQEVAQMLAEAWTLARDAVRTHRAPLDALVAVLVERRTVGGHELAALLPPRPAGPAIVTA